MWFPESPPSSSSRAPSVLHPPHLSYCSPLPARHTPRLGDGRILNPPEESPCQSLLSASTMLPKAPTPHPALPLFLRTAEVFLRGSDGKESACNAGDRVRSLRQEDLPEKKMATHSRILAGTIPWKVKPGGLQSVTGPSMQAPHTGFLSILCSSSQLLRLGPPPDLPIHSHGFRDGPDLGCPMWSDLRACLAPWPRTLPSAPTHRALWICHLDLQQAFGHPVGRADPRGRRQCLESQKLSLSPDHTIPDIPYLLF